MRLLTRSDFDGLVCGALLREVGVVTSYKFIHPKDLQDGTIEVTKDDVLANVPYAPGCGLWFDHHSSEDERNAHKGKFEGDSRPAPSCARIIYEFYGGEERFPHLAEMMDAVDKIDSGQLTKEEILDPEDWVLIGFVMDPRTGLGRFSNFTISNYQLMEKLLQCCRGMNVHQILELPDVVERVDVYEEQTKLFKEMLKKHTRVEKDVIITDLRDINHPMYAGNRFIVYSLYPQQNISVWIAPGKREQGHGVKSCSVAVGHSVLNRTSKVDVGSLMLKFGGGGHKMVGTCQLADDIVDRDLPKILDAIINHK